MSEEKMFGMFKVRLDSEIPYGEFILTCKSKDELNLFFYSRADLLQLITKLENTLQARIDELEAEIARRDEELLELNNDKAVFIKFENEDELPAEIKDDVYRAIFECSHVDGVRLFPYIEENGQKYFLAMLKEVV